MNIGRSRKRNVWLGPPRHLGVVHGNIVDVRSDGWGNETVLLNGASVSKKSAVFTVPSHLFTITDEAGKTRNVEVRRVERLGGLFGIRGYLVAVDGVDRGLLKPFGSTQPTDRCLQCGYELANLRVVNGEVQCPECGRHREAELLGMDNRQRTASDESAAADR